VQYTEQVRLHYGASRYGASKLRFRGPQRRADGEYIAFLGGSEVYGKFVERPVSDRVETALKLPCLNLGCMNAGLDAFLKDPSALDVAGRSVATVIQITGAQNNSNRFYVVHPRRNDRLVTASPALQALFPAVDFGDVHYTRHALHELLAASAERFDLVVDELKTAWVKRMELLLSMIPGPKLLLRMARYDLSETGSLRAGDPLFVDADMLAALSGQIDGLVDYTLSEKAASEGVSGMIFGPEDEPAARCLLGAQAHAEAADMLIAPLRKLCRRKQIRAA